MIVVARAGFAQIQPSSSSNSLLSIQPKTNNWQSFIVQNTNYKPRGIEAIIPADFYSKQLGFFCKQEIKIDRVTKIPFRFRLGSVEQCNKLEGKRW